MSRELEQKVIAYALMNKQELEENELDSRWFEDKKYREIAQVLEVVKSEFEDYFEIISRIKSHKPFTEVTADFLETEQYNAYSVQSFPSAVKSLKKEYYKKIVQQASKLYADVPSEENYEALQDAQTEYKESQIELDDGSLEEATGDLEYQLENEKENGIRVFKEFDEILGDGFEPGRFYVIAARPGSGKTAWGVSSIINGISNDPRLTVDLFSLEMTKIHMLKRFIGNLSKINTYKLKNPKVSLTQDQKRSVIEKNSYLKATNLKMHDKRFNLNEITTQIAVSKKECGNNPYIAYIDYLQLIKTTGRFQNRQVELGHITRELKLLANSIGVPIVVFAQLSRASEDREKPAVRDLRESGDIEQNADVVGLMHTDKDDENLIHFDVAKNRDGKVGGITYHFFKPHMYFEEVTDD